MGSRRNTVALATWLWIWCSVARWFQTAPAKVGDTVNHGRSLPFTSRILPNCASFKRRISNGSLGVLCRKFSISITSDPLLYFTVTFCHKPLYVKIPHTLNTAIFCHKKCKAKNSTISNLGSNKKLSLSDLTPG